MTEIGNKIKELRKQRKLTLDKLAEMTGVAKATLSRIENGVVGGNIETVRKIAESLGVGLEDLYSSGERKAEKPGLQLSRLRGELKGITQRLVKLCAELGVKVDKA